MKVILKETIESLGIIGSEADVKAGYARNYLIPQGKAVQATKENRKKMEQERAKIELQLAKERKLAEEMAARLEGITVQIPAKVADEDRLYGSVAVRDIAEALEQKGIEVEKRSILLADPIKTLGTYQVPVRVYRDVEPEITVEVVPES
ncbi:large subunit ribosomal protein L9 [Desulfosalsimonas propionicica]|uniref:Large ribosomal subunit protein bL9 n=1 Tax=Desulfosalsimonas propionicica TaxID=332175 RepID=A0A7W0C9X0_9BACT|nr:50S ribosomal protein L9 [Desulfosalsimonas propionicica]MBA2881787.1 large subunit ribosomal protein L9 [Desulfosalsimonas propionicica]